MWNVNVHNCARGKVKKVTFKESGVKGQASPVHGRTFVGKKQNSFFFKQLVKKQLNTVRHFTTGGVKHFTQSAVNPTGS